MIEDLHGKLLDFKSPFLIIIARTGHFVAQGSVDAADQIAYQKQHHLRRFLCLRARCSGICTRLVVQELAGAGSRQHALPVCKQWCSRISDRHRNASDGWDLIGTSQRIFSDLRLEKGWQVGKQRAEGESRSLAMRNAAPSLLTESQQHLAKSTSAASDAAVHAWRPRAALLWETGGRSMVGDPGRIRGEAAPCSRR